MLYLGIDQHKRQLTVNLRGEDGSVILKRQVSTQWEKVRAGCHGLCCCGDARSSAIYRIVCRVPLRVTRPPCAFGGDLRGRVPLLGVVRAEPLGPSFRQLQAVLVQRPSGFPIPANRLGSRHGEDRRVGSRFGTAWDCSTVIRYWRTRSIPSRGTRTRGRVPGPLARRNSIAQVGAAGAALGNRRAAKDPQGPTGRDPAQRRCSLNSIACGSCQVPGVTARWAFGVSVSGKRPQGSAEPPPWAAGLGPFRAVDPVARIARPRTGRGGSACLAARRVGSAAGWWLEMRGVGRIEKDRGNSHDDHHGSRSAGLSFGPHTPIDAG